MPIVIVGHLVGWQLDKRSLTSANNIMLEIFASDSKFKMSYLLTHTLTSRDYGLHWLLQNYYILHWGAGAHPCKRVVNYSNKAHRASIQRSSLWQIHEANKRAYTAIIYCSYRPFFDWVFNTMHTWQTTVTQLCFNTHPYPPPPSQQKIICYVYMWLTVAFMYTYTVKNEVRLTH